MKLTRKQLILNAVLCLALLGAVIWALYSEYARPWKEYQKEFRRQEYDLTAKEYQALLLKSNEAPKDLAPGIPESRPQEKDGEETPSEGKKGESAEERIELLRNRLAIISKRREKIRQVWLQDIDETDRCITCHQGADRPEFINLPQPYKTHSGLYISQHPIERFGCVLCHEGQGTALTVKAAHGDVKNWERPVLKSPFVQSSCGKCHAMEQDLPLSSKLPGASAFTAGWRLFQEYNCTGCHKLQGYKRPEYIAPSLDSAGIKLRKKWLVQWLKEPGKYLPGTKMPVFNRSSEEVEQIADYLLSLKKVPAGSNAWGLPETMAVVPAEGAVREGKDLVNSLGCLGCHRINKKGSGFAPELSRIGDKVNSEWLMQWLKAPGTYQPDSTMPDLNLPDEEVRSITAYLMTLKRPASVFTLRRGEVAEQAVISQESAEKGRELVADLGCTGCHKIEKLPAGYDAPQLDGIGSKRTDELVFANITGAEKTLVNWLQIKMADPGKFATDRIITRMPDYGFSAMQAEDLAVFLLGLKKESLPLKYTKKLLQAETTEAGGRKIIEKYNCTGCHKIGNEGGTIGPALTGEAKKSRPEWMFGFLKKPYKIRPEGILRAKMPDFGLSDKEINTILDYLAFMSGEPYPFYSVQKDNVRPEDIYDGEKLYQEIFACSACHRVNNTGGQVGPDHTDLASRVKRKWLETWLKDPQAIKPDVIMPTFTFRDWEFKALTDYLMTRGEYRFVQVNNIN